jgi:voltage-gated potassium channel
LLKQEQTPGGNVMRRKKRITRFKRFVDDIFIHTPFVKMIFLLISLWLIFSAGLYTAEHGIYWGIAAFSTAGIADTPVSGISQIIGGIWIVAGSALFFGTIVATITTYFMRPLHRPAKQIIDTIEYNLEQLDDLSIEELDLLKKTTDGLILHMEHLKKKQKNKAHNKPRF